MMLIEVTQEHIDKAASRNGWDGCPITLAMQEQIGIGIDVRVGPHYINMHSKYGDLSIKVTPGIKKFSELFDTYQFVGPSKFLIDVSLSEITNKCLF